MPEITGTEAETGVGAQPFTQDELREQVRELQLLDEADEEAFAEYLFADYDAQRADLKETYYNALVNQLTGQASQEILDRAAALADNAAESLLRTISKADLNAIGQTISEGIAQGLGPRQIARNLEEVQGLDANRVKQFEKFRAGLEDSDMTDSQIAAAEEREYQRLLKERRETIARTESNFAVSEGDRLEAERSGKRFKVWQTTGDSSVSNECQKNEAAGPIPIDEEFPGGVATTPQHPNCRCSVTYISSDTQVERSAERAAERAKRTADAKADAKGDKQNV